MIAISQTWWWCESHLTHNLSGFWPFILFMFRRRSFVLFLNQRWLPCSHIEITIPNRSGKQKPNSVYNYYQHYSYRTRYFFPHGAKLNISQDLCVYFIFHVWRNKIIVYETIHELNLCYALGGLISRVGYQWIMVDSMSNNPHCQFMETHNQQCTTSLSMSTPMICLIWFGLFGV